MHSLIHSSGKHLCAPIGARHCFRKYSQTPVSRKAAGIWTQRTRERIRVTNSVFTSSNTQKAQCKNTVKTSSVHLLGRDEESSEKNSFYFSGKSDDYPFLGNKMRERRVEEVCRLEERRMWQIIILWSGRISN